jgi:hypothetical protein
VATADDITAEFLRETGDAPSLVQPPAAWVRSGLSVQGHQLKPSPSSPLRERLGEFLITIYEGDPPDPATAGALFDPREDVRWLRQADDDRTGLALWMATRIYGNVWVSRWDSAKRLDSRWTTLTGIVERATKR